MHKILFPCSGETISGSQEQNIEMRKERKPNRLIGEKSPYLLRHAYNPVDWYPWCDEAFEKAREVADFILSAMRAGDGGLYHRYREGEAGVRGFIDDYAFFIWGLIELYQATFETRYLEEAVRLANYAVEHFWDGENGEFFFTPDNAEDALIVRQKENRDGAYPSGNSVMLYNLVRISRMTGRVEFEELARKMIKPFSSEVRRIPSMHSMFLVGFDFLANDTLEVVVVGERDSRDTAEIVRTIYDGFHPFTVVLLKYPGSGIRHVAGYVEGMTRINDRPTAYICRGFSCDLPSTDREEVRKKLEMA